MLCYSLTILLYISSLKFDFHSCIFDSIIILVLCDVCFGEKNYYIVRAHTSLS